MAHQITCHSFPYYFALISLPLSYSSTSSTLFKLVILDSYFSPIFQIPLSFPYLYPDHNLDSLFPITFTSVSFLSLASRELDFLVCLFIIWIKNVIQNKHFYWKNKSKSNQQISNYSFQNVLIIFVDMARVQFHQHVHLRLLCAQIPKAQENSQVISVSLRFWDLGPIL